MPDEQPDLSLLDNAANQNQFTTHSDFDLANQEKKHLFTDKERGNKYKGHLYNIGVIFIYVGGFCLILLLLIRVYDFIAPGCWRWLSEKEDHEIERILFSGVIVSLATKYFKKYDIVS